MFVSNNVWLFDFVLNVQNNYLIAFSATACTVVDLQKSFYLSLFPIFQTALPQWVIYLYWYEVFFLKYFALRKKNWCSQHGILYFQFLILYHVFYI